MNTTKGFGVMLVLVVVAILGIGGFVFLHGKPSSQTSRLLQAGAPTATSPILPMSGASSPVSVVSPQKTGVKTAKENREIEPGTINGRVVDQYGKPLKFSMLTDISVVDALGDVAETPPINGDNGVIKTKKLSPGKYTVLIPLQGGQRNKLPSPWECKCFPKKVDVQLPESGVDLGMVELVRFAVVTSGGLYNEVGTQINDTLTYQFTDIETTDPSLETASESSFTLRPLGGQLLYGNTGLIVALPPGKYTIVIKDAGKRYADKAMSFEVRDKDIDLGKIVLKKI